MYKLLLIILLLFTSQSYANTLVVPALFEVLKVDGKKFDSGFFRTEQSIKLVNGQHVILLRYEELFEDMENDDHTIVKSEPFVVMFNINQVPLKLVAKPNIDEADALKFIEKPKVSLVDKNNTPVNSTTMLLSEFEQDQFQQVLAEKVVKASAMNDNKASVKTNHSKPTIAANVNTMSDSKSSTNKEAKVQPVSSNVQDSRALDMLNYWWQQASAEQKQMFISNMITNKD